MEKSLKELQVRIKKLKERFIYLLSELANFFYSKLATRSRRIIEAHKTHFDAENTYSHI